MDQPRLREKIRSDSPDLIELEIGSGCFPSGYVPDDHDWTGLGRHIGQLAHLKQLTIRVRDEDFRNPLDSNGEVEQFFRGVADNQSIETLLLHSGNGTTIRNGMVFDLLTPFFKNNRNFKCLCLNCIEKMTPLGIHGLGKAMGEFTQLKEFELNGTCNLPGELFQALHGHPSLEKLSLSRANIERDGCVALSSLLKKPDSAIQVLKLLFITMDDYGAEVVGSVLAGSRSLKEISLFGIRELFGRGRQASFTALQNSSRSILEKLDLGRSGLDNAVLVSLFSALAHRPNLKKLALESMAMNGDVAHTSWGALFGFLISQENKLEELDLSCNRLNRDLIPLLGTSLAQNSTLKNLVLNEILTTPSDWGVLTASISIILGNQNSALERLDLRDNDFYDFDEKSEALISLAASLEINTSLKELLLEDEAEDEEDMPPVTLQAWSAFSSVLSSTSSIMATFNSNHTLQELELPNVPRDIASLLELNKKSNGKAARLKIINTHFSGHFDVRPFVEMGMKTLPHAVAWISRGGTVNEMYQLLVKYAFVRKV